MSFHIYEDGYITFCKNFNGEYEYYDFGFLFNSYNLRWTIPIVERKGKRKERFRFFYPKYKSDKFIFKLAFENGYGEIILNQYGLLNSDGEIINSYQYIINVLYKKRELTLIKKLIDIHKKEDFYEIYLSEIYLSKISESLKLEIGSKSNEILEKDADDFSLDDLNFENDIIINPVKEDTLKVKIEKIEKEIEKIKSFDENNYK